jgi:hypothetical protein
MESVDYNTEQEVVVEENIGYLALGGMDVTVIEDTENIDSTTRA